MAAQNIVKDETQVKTKTYWENAIDYARKYDVDLSGMVVCLDNGHSKATKGKGSPWSLHKVEPAIPLREYEFARKVVAKLKELLENMGARVYLVCPEVDTETSLSARAARANKLKTVYKNEGKPIKFVFVSVHADAIGDGTKWVPGSNGWAVWTTKGQNVSDVFADCMWEAANEVFTPMGMRMRQQKANDGDPDYEADFTVIKKANMPAVLTENFFYTDPGDCAFISSDAGVEAIAVAHAKGIGKFAQRRYGHKTRAEYRKERDERNKEIERLYDEQFGNQNAPN